MFERSDWNSTASFIMQKNTVIQNNWSYCYISRVFSNIQSYSKFAARNGRGKYSNRKPFCKQLHICQNTWFPQIENDSTCSSSHNSSERSRASSAMMVPHLLTKATPVIWPGFHHILQSGCKPKKREHTEICEMKHVTSKTNRGKQREVTFFLVSQIFWDFAAKSLVVHGGNRGHRFLCFFLAAYMAQSKSQAKN